MELCDFMQGFVCLLLISVINSPPQENKQYMVCMQCIIILYIYLTYMCCVLGKNRQVI